MLFQRDTVLTLLEFEKSGRAYEINCHPKQFRCENDVEPMANPLILNLQK